MSSKADWLKERKRYYSDKYDQLMSIIDLFDRLIEDAENEEQEGPRYRDAVTGMYVSKEIAEADPDKHVKETE